MSRDPSLALTREYAAGTMLFEENDPGSRMYVIRTGKVRIFRRVGDNDLVLAFLGPGDFFGEMALLEGLPRSADAEVVETSTLVEVDGSTFEEMVRTNAEVALRIMRNLAARVRELDHRIEQLLLDSLLGRAVEVLRWLLSQGVDEGQFVRVKLGALHVDLAAQAAIPHGQAALVEQQLTQAGLIVRDGDDLLVANTETLEQFSAYLTMKKHYEPPASVPAEAAGLTHKDEMRQAVTRLVEALHMTPEEIERRQSVLAAHYTRFAKLKQRFRSAESSER